MKNEELTRACLKRLRNVYTGWMSALWQAERGPEITLRGLGRGRQRFLGASEFLNFVLDLSKIRAFKKFICWTTFFCFWLLAESATLLLVPRGLAWTIQAFGKRNKKLTRHLSGGQQGQQGQQSEQGLAIQGFGKKEQKVDKSVGQATFEACSSQLSAFRLVD